MPDAYPASPTEQEIQQKLARHDAVMAEMKLLLAKSESEDGLSEEDQAKFDALDAEGKALTEWLSASDGRQTTPTAPQGSITQPGGSGPVFTDAQTGRHVHGLTADEPMSQPLSVPVGDIVRSLLLNDSSSLPRDIQASLTGGSDSGGGYLLSPQLSSIFVDLARAASVVVKAGAVSIPMGAAEMVLGRLLTDPTAQWRGETVGISASRPTFGRIVLRPKTVGAIVPVSIELLEDAANAGSVIEMALRNALGLALDQAALTGSGASAEPLGVVNHPDVNTIASVGTPASYAGVSAAVGDILGANFDGDPEQLAWIMNPRDGETFDNLTDTTGQPLQPTPWAGKLRQLQTTSLEPNGSAETDMVIGDFGQMLIGARTSGIRIEVLDQGTVTDADGDSWNASTQLLRHIREPTPASGAQSRSKQYATMLRRSSDRDLADIGAVIARMREWSARYRRFVSDGTVNSVTSYGRVNTSPPCCLFATTIAAPSKSRYPWRLRLRSS